MKCKKISEKFFVSMISCMMVFTAFACSNGEEGENKDVLVLESEKITMMEFSKPVSLLPWCVSFVKYEVKTLLYKDGDLKEHNSTLAL